MILKPPSTTPLPTDPRLRAGVQAERQMAHYLHRAFATSADLYVINDLRLVDPEQPEHDGSPGVAQIDHLVLHRYGAFIVESKSVSETLTVRDATKQGGGGDEWTRGGKGMASPLGQAERQGELMRNFLQRHRRTLVGKMPVGLRTVARVLHGDDQRGFRNLPIQCIVAIADHGQIKRLGGWSPPKEGFRSFLLKADNVAKVIQGESDKHRKAGLGRLRDPDGYGEYGFWSMKPEELAAVADFLIASHTPRTASNAPRKPALANPPPAAEPKAEPTPPCPRCGTPTVLRYAKKGANAGQPFFGCPSFPKCRGVVPIASPTGAP